MRSPSSRTSINCWGYEMDAAGDDRPSAPEKIGRFCDAYFRKRQVDNDGFPLPPTRPYPGLRSPLPREARLFFVRQSEAAELRRRLSVSNVVFVLGGSGSGKSSLVLAGVLPRLNELVGSQAGPAVSISQPSDPVTAYARRSPKRSGTTCASLYLAEAWSRGLRASFVEEGREWRQSQL